MSQLALFSEPTPRSEVVPLPEFAENAEYDDSQGCGVASHSLTMQSPFWDWCRSGLWVSLERHFGYKPHRWMASVHLELPDDLRTQWVRREIFATQDEAAMEAADMATAARKMLMRHLRGEDVETPGRRAERAAEAFADASPEWLSAAEFERIQRRALDGLDENDPERWTAASRWQSAKKAAADVRRNIVDEFYRIHGWREFAADLL